MASPLSVLSLRPGRQIPPIRETSLHSQRCQRTGRTTWRTEPDPLPHRGQEHRPPQRTLHRRRKEILPRKSFRPGGSGENRIIVHINPHHAYKHWKVSCMMGTCFIYLYNANHTEQSKLDYLFKILPCFIRPCFYHPYLPHVLYHRLFQVVLLTS